MKKLFVLFSLIPALVFGQQNIKQVLTNGNNAGGKSLIGASLIGLNGATSGTVTVKGPAVITTYTFSLPANAGTSGYVLQTNGSGVTSWVAAGLTVGSTAIASGTSGRVLYDNAGTLGEKVVWNIDGNASTTASTDFIGTTDAVNFRIQRNGLVGAVFKSSGDIFIGNKGSGYMYFDYANARLGIQDSTPARIFVINGSGANNYPRLNTDASHDMFLEWSVGGTAKGYLGTHNNDAYVQFSNPLGNIIQTWSTSNEDVFFPDADGVVGLGVTSASAKLHVKGSGATSATSNMLIANSASTTLFDSKDDGRKVFTGTYQQVDMLASGDVRIGNAANTGLYWQISTAHLGINIDAPASDAVLDINTVGVNNFLYLRGAAAHERGIKFYNTVSTKYSGWFAQADSIYFEGANSQNHLILNKGTSDILYFPYIHNNATSPTGIIPLIASGTYTATITDSANTSARTAYQSQWTRVGNVVTVSGVVDVDPTLAVTSTIIKISLPIPSNFTIVGNCRGTATCGTIAGQSAAILETTAYGVADFALMKWFSGDVTNQPMSYIFTYLVQ